MPGCHVSKKFGRCGFDLGGASTRIVLQVSVRELFSLMQLHPVTVSARSWIGRLARPQQPVAIYLDAVTRGRELEARACESMGLWCQAFVSWSYTRV